MTDASLKAASDTPDVDKEVRTNVGKLLRREPAQWVPADFARSLERRLREAKAALATAQRDADHFFQLSGRYLEELATARRDALEEAAWHCEKHIFPPQATSDDMWLRGANDACMRLAYLIRALKEKK